MPATGFCITNYNVGDNLNVLAPSGLVLRATASPQGKKISTVLLGETVTVLKENFKKVPHSVVEFKGFNIKGFWVKVSTAAGQQGYVFDGYLSRYKAPGSFDTNGAEDDYSPAERYLLGHTEQRGERIELAKTPNRYVRYKQAFQNNAEVEVNIGEGGAAYTLTFDKGLTLEEGYLIGRLLWLEGPLKSTLENGVITVSNAAETQLITVLNRGGTVILTMSIAD